MKTTITMIIYRKVKKTPKNVKKTPKNVKKCQKCQKIAPFPFF